MQCSAAAFDIEKHYGVTNSMFASLKMFETFMLCVPGITRRRYTTAVKEKAATNCSVHRFICGFVFGLTVFKTPIKSKVMS